MTIESYFSVFYILLGVSAFFLVLSVILFFKLHIARTFLELTGIAKAREMKDYEDVSAIASKDSELFTQNSAPQMSVSAREVAPPPKKRTEPTHVEMPSYDNGAGTSMLTMEETAVEPEEPLNVQQEPEIVTFEHVYNEDELDPVTETVQQEEENIQAPVHNGTTMLDLEIENPVPSGTTILSNGTTVLALDDDTFTSSTEII